MKQLISCLYSPYCYIIIVLFLFHTSQSAAQTLSLVRPNGGETIAANTTYTITWDAPSTAMELLSISLWNSDMGHWTLLASDVPARSKTFVWNIPSTMQGERFRIKIQSQDNPDIFDLSDTFFSIAPSNTPLPPKNTPAQELQHIRIVPNPAQEYVHVSWVGEAVWLRVWDIPGRTVLFYPLDRHQNYSFSVAELIAGIYMVEVALSDGTMLYGNAFVVP